MRSDAEKRAKAWGIQLVLPGRCLAMSNVAQSGEVFPPLADGGAVHFSADHLLAGIGFKN